MHVMPVSQLGEASKPEGRRRLHGCNAGSSQQGGEKARGGIGLQFDSRECCSLYRY